jgi:hypothetical protein
MTATPLRHHRRMPSLIDDVDWPIHTERLLLRPATPDDLGSTWHIRRLDSVSRRLTRAPRTLDEHTEHFGDRESLAKTLIIQLEDDVIGDLMVAIGDAWA